MVGRASCLDGVRRSAINGRRGAGPTRARGGQGEGRGAPVRLTQVWLLTQSSRMNERGLAAPHRILMSAAFVFVRTEAS